MIVLVSFLSGEMHRSEPSLVPDQYPKYSLAKNMFDNFFKTEQAQYFTFEYIISVFKALSDINLILSFNQTKI